jgi:hypothetical protein
MTSRTCSIMLNLELFITRPPIATKPSCEYLAPRYQTPITLPLPREKASLPLPLFLLCRRVERLQQQQHFLHAMSTMNTYAVVRSEARTLLRGNRRSTSQLGHLEERILPCNARVRHIYMINDGCR